MIMPQQTPTQAPVALVLGGTIPHKHLIDNLKRRGFNVILIDYHENPPAKEVANRHIRESTLDKEKALEIARHTGASLVISGCVDQANVTACYVSEEIGLRAPYTYANAIRCTDKSLMKKGFVHAGVPSSEYEVIARGKPFTGSPFAYPVVVKPSDSNGSKGVRIARSDVELEGYIWDARKISRSGDVVVESFNDGDEVSIQYIVRKDEVLEILTMARIKPADPRYALQAFQILSPARISDLARKKLKEYGRLICREFGINNSPFLLQANVAGDDVKIIEFAPRVGGGLAFRLAQEVVNYDLIDAAVKSCLGETIPEAGAMSERAYEYLILSLYATGGVLDHVEGFSDMVEDGTIEELHMYKTPGALMGGDLSSSNRVMGVILRGCDRDELNRKMMRVVWNGRIVSRDNGDCTNREVVNLI